MKAIYYHFLFPPLLFFKKEHIFPMIEAKLIKRANFQTLVSQKLLEFLDSDNINFIFLYTTTMCYIFEISCFCIFKNLIIPTHTFLPVVPYLSVLSLYLYSSYSTLNYCLMLFCVLFLLSFFLSLFSFIPTHKYNHQYLHSA